MPTDRKLTYGRRTRELDLQPQSPSLAEVPAQPSEAGAMPVRTLKGYEKTDGTLSYSIVCVISGGERKEKDFLRELIRQKELRSLRVALFPRRDKGCNLTRCKRYGLPSGSQEKLHLPTSIISWTIWIRYSC